MAVKSSLGQGQDVMVKAGNDSQPAEICKNDDPRPCAVLEAELKKTNVCYGIAHVQVTKRPH